MYFSHLLLSTIMKMLTSSLEAALINIAHNEEV